jgi:CRP/FNR family transcriptional regulator, cyclic AMP receptor protein
MVNPDIFNEVPLFSLLDAEERQVLAQLVSAKTFIKGETIFQAGDPGNYAYLVQYGLVHVSIKDIVHEHVIVDVVESGGLLGMSSLLAGAEHLTTAVAMEDTCAIEIDRNDISILLQQKPLAGLDMMTMIESQLRSTHELMRTRVSRNPNIEIEETETLGEKLADMVAKFGGSWAFIIFFAVILIIYTMINHLIQKPWDPYPFILLNLFLSMLAAIQAPIIMMSQNRQDAKDRLRSELDYRVNLKAELEIGEMLLRIGKLEQRLLDVVGKKNKDALASS